MNNYKSKFSDKDIALLLIGNSSFIETPNIAYINEYLSCIGRKICEFRLIQNIKSDIESALQDLSQNFNLTLVAGSFGFQLHHYAVQIISDIFKTHVKINNEAREIYMNRLELHNILYEEQYQKAFMLPQNSLVIKLENGINFAFRYANIICFDESSKTLNEIITILRDTIQHSHIHSTRHVFTDIPAEVFYLPIENLAREMGVKWNINHKHDNHVMIVAQHTDAMLVKKFITEVEKIMNDIATHINADK